MTGIVMNPFASLLMPSLIGLLAGISHGLVSHELNLPVSLPEQFAEVFSQNVNDY